MATRSLFLYYIQIPRDLNNLPFEGKNTITWPFGRQLYRHITDCGRGVPIFEKINHVTMRAGEMLTTENAWRKNLTVEQCTCGKTQPRKMRVGKKLRVENVKSDKFNYGKCAFGKS